MEAVTNSENVTRQFDLDRKQKNLEIIKEIAQFDLSGNLVSLYLDKWDAEAKTGVPRNQIIQCVLGHKRTAKGFYWKNSFKEQVLPVDAKHKRLIEIKSTRSLWKTPLIMRKIRGTKAVVEQEFHNITASLTISPHPNSQWYLCCTQNIPVFTN